MRPMLSGQRTRASAAAFVLMQLVACGSESQRGAGADADGASGAVAEVTASDSAAPTAPPATSAAHDASAGIVATPAAADAGPAPHAAGGGPMLEDAHVAEASTAAPDAGTTTGVPTLYFLDIAGSRVMRADPNARTSQAIVTSGSSLPDGIAVDVAHAALYWTNMGLPDSNDGFVLRADVGGTNVKTVVPKAATFTPKQLHLDTVNGLLYWSDREGMRVMRARTDGTQLETLVVTGSGDAARADAVNWAVGIGVDLEGQKVYWTQKGPDDGQTGSIRRAGLTAKPGEDPARRSDIEVLFTGLAAPVDLDLDLVHHHLYWTSRGDKTVSRAPMEPPPGVAPDKRTDRSILVRNAGTAIGIALDVAHEVMYYTSLEGIVAKAKLDGSGATPILQNQGSLTGIAYVELHP